MRYYLYVSNFFGRIINQLFFLVSIICSSVYGYSQNAGLSSYAPAIEVNSLPSAISRAPRLIEIFYKGPNNHLWTCSRSDTGQWTSPTDICPIELTSAPTAVVRRENQVDIFYRGPNHHLWTTWWDYKRRWNTAREIGQMELIGAPVALVADSNAIDIFYRGSNHHLWTTTLNDRNQWTEARDLGGNEMTSDPAAIYESGIGILVFYTGADHQLWMRSKRLICDGNWGQPEMIRGAKMLSTPAIIKGKENELLLFYIGMNNQVWKSSLSVTNFSTKSINLGGYPLKGGVTAFADNSGGTDILYTGTSGHLLTGYLGKGPHGNEILQLPRFSYIIELESAFPYKYDPVSDHWVPYYVSGISGHGGISGITLQYKLKNPGAPIKDGFIQCIIDNIPVITTNPVSANAVNVNGTLNIPDLTPGFHTITLNYQTDVHLTPVITSSGITFVSQTATTSATSDFYFSPSCDWSVLVSKIKQILLTKQGVDLGTAVTTDKSFTGLLHYQQFKSQTYYDNTIEMNSDGTIYITATPFKTPNWYQSYYAYDGTYPFNYKVFSPDDSHFQEGSLLYSPNSSSPGSIETSLNLVEAPDHSLETLERLENDEEHLFEFVLVNGKYKALTNLPPPNYYWMSYRLDPNSPSQTITPVEGPTTASPTIIDDDIFFVDPGYSNPYSVNLKIDGNTTFGILKDANFDKTKWNSFPKSAIPQNHEPFPKWYKLQLPDAANLSGDHTCDWVNFLLNGDGHPDDLNLLVNGATTPFPFTVDYSHSPYVDGNCDSYATGSVLNKHTYGCPEWQTILPVGLRLGQKTDDNGYLYTWDGIFHDMQVNEGNASVHLQWNGHPNNPNRENTVPWVTSYAQGLVANSWQAGDDASIDHMDKPDGFWLGNLPSLHTDAWCGILHADGSICADWCFFVDPDLEYVFLKGGLQDISCNEIFESTFLPCEIETWNIPTDYRPEPGDRILVGGRWIVDCGHCDFHTEIHPVEMFTSSHLSIADGQPMNDTSLIKVVVTGAWNGGTLQFDLWPPVRTDEFQKLHFNKTDDQVLGLSVTEKLLPVGNPNHIQVTVQAPDNQSGTGPSGDVYPKADLRLASKYRLWWKGISMQTVGSYSAIYQELNVNALSLLQTNVKEYVQSNDIHESVSGTWQFQMSSKSGIMQKGKVELLQDDKALSGNMTFGDGKAFAVGGTYKGQNINLERNTGLATIQVYDLVKKDITHFTGTYHNVGRFPDDGIIEFEKVEK